MEIHPAEHGIQIGQEPIFPSLHKLLPKKLQGSPGVFQTTLVNVIAHQQAAGGKLDVRRAVLLNLPHPGDHRQKPLGNILALFELAFRQGAVRQADAVRPQ